MKRSDYAFPFRIDSASGQGARTPTYEAHVAQMIRQVLLTSPRERVNRPLFGCGLRTLIFAPNADPLAAAVKMRVTQALKDHLSDHIDVHAVTVFKPGEIEEDNKLVLRIDYILRQNLKPQSTEVLIP